MRLRSATCSRYVQHRPDLFGRFGSGRPSLPHDLPRAAHLGHFSSFRSSTRTRISLGTRSVITKSTAPRSMRCGGCAGRKRVGYEMGDHIVDLFSVVLHGVPDDPRAAWRVDWVPVARDYPDSTSVRSGQCAGAAGTCVGVDDARPAVDLLIGDPLAHSDCVENLPA